MIKAHWTDLPHMPIRARLLCMASSFVRPGVADMKPEEIAAKRALTPPPRFPITLITGRVRRNVHRHDIAVRMSDGVAISTRIFRRPDVSGSAPVVIYYHGGGWTLGRPLDYESLLTQVADETGAVVVAPDYRKAPENKAPAAVLDAIDLLDAVLGSPDWLPVTPTRVAVAGDSAGGNLSAVVALHAREAIVGQALIYPAVDLTREHTYRDAPLLDGPALDTYKALYLDGSDIEPADPRISPLLATSHVGVSPALIQTAEFDPLAPEGAEYARALQRAGVDVRFTHYRGVPHGFLNIPGAAPVAGQARWEVVDTLRGWLT